MNRESKRILAMLALGVAMVGVLAACGTNKSADGFDDGQAKADKACAAQNQNVATWQKTVDSISAEQDAVVNTIDATPNGETNSALSSQYNDTVNRYNAADSELANAVDAQNQCYMESAANPAR